MQKGLMAMTALEELADLLFPDPLKTPEEYEALYPSRPLPEGARVTRFAPSPTGYLHLGVFFTATIDRLTADASNGIFYFRLEDTDKKREVADGEEDILRGLAAYGLAVDEGIVAPGIVRGDYGPYRQSERRSIYHTYAKKLVLEGLAYPCFCTSETLEKIRLEQKEKKLRTGYYGSYACCRNLAPEEAISRIRSGESYVLRLRAPGDPERRIKFDDLIKGVVEMPENDEDFVLLKSDGIPTYHFAHAVDDHLMRTTHVIRGDEWISSVPKHMQLFQLLGFKIPKYAHVSPILKEDGAGKRKLSKRKDPEAAMHFYTEQGYPVEGVREYLMTIANSDYEEWRKCNPDAPRSSFPFSLKKMSVSGALFDLNKLNDVCKNMIARMDAHTVTGHIRNWAEQYHPDFSRLLEQDPAYAEAVFSIDRGGPKPRKDLAKWSDAPEYAAYFYTAPDPASLVYPETLQKEDIAAVLTAYRNIYDPQDDQPAWFARIKSMASSLGFCPEVKEYKKNPGAWKGHVGDVSTVLRIAVTGRRNTPDLCAIMRLLGPEEVKRRLTSAVL